MAPRGSRDQRPAPAHTIFAECVESFADDADIHALAEAATAAILDGGGFGWVKARNRATMEQYLRGIPLVPERELIVGRMDGTVYGAAQLQKPSRNNEAQAHAVHLMHHFVAPYARGHGLARLILRKAEERARALGFRVLNLDVRDTQKAPFRSTNPKALSAGAPTPPMPGSKAG